MKILVLLMALFTFSVGAAETVTFNEDNTVSLKDAVMSGSVTQTINELAKRENNSEPVIYLVLDTPGGSVFAGLNLIHYLKGYKKPVKTVTIFAASMGFQIVNGNPGERLIVDTGVLMSHPMSGGLGGEMGNGLSLDNRNGYIKEIIDTMDKQAAARTNGKVSLAEYQKAYDNELWTTGQNAVDKGYADAVTLASCSEGLSASTDTIDEREFIGFSMMGPLALQIKYEVSRCPLQMSILRYQVAIVNAATEERFVLQNSGYDIEGKNSSVQQGLQLGQNKSESIEIEKSIQNSVRYKTFEFFLKRDLSSVRGISWF
jgi:ATP-dependent Clp protease protease subunit